MNYGFHLLFVMVMLGLIVKKPTWKFWFGVSMTMAVFMLYNWKF